MHYTLTPNDVGKPFLKAFGRTWLTSNFIGRVLATDVGQRAYLRGNVLQVENDAQRSGRVGDAQRRLKHGGKNK